MATTPQQIKSSLTGGADTLYTFPVAGGATRGVLEAIHVCNITTSPVTFDLYVLASDGTTKHYLYKNLSIPASAVLDLATMITVKDATGSAEKIVALAGTATALDVTGTVIENA